MGQEASALGNVLCCRNAVCDDQADSDAGATATGHSFWDPHLQLHAVLHCHPLAGAPQVPCKPTMLHTKDVFQIVRSLCSVGSSCPEDIATLSASTMSQHVLVHHPIVNMFMLK